MKIIKGGVTAAKGFKACGIHCGIKKKKKDLAIIYSEIPAITSALFTINKVKAEPLILSQKQLMKNSKFNAIIANSGNANACTGKQGMANALKTVDIAAKELNAEKKSILIASTGMIGKQLQIDKIISGIKTAVPLLSKNGSSSAASAILTTDTFTKEIAVEIKISGVAVRIGGIAKGSGMIYPNMATMLCFISTDALIDKKALDYVLKTAVDKSFNSITVDGDRSTNDMVSIFANGVAKNKLLTIKSKGLGEFAKGIEFVCIQLAKMIVKDGEGATKFIEIKVSGAKTYADAKKVGFSIANSNLVKCAMFGEDPNWGRVVSAVGNSGIELKLEKIKVYFNNKLIYKNSTPVAGAREKIHKSLTKKEILISVDLGVGDKSSSVWTSDLSYGYVKINAEYN